MNDIFKPFLKWAGGKTSVLSHILPKLPSGKRFIEPFLGAGVVFLNTHYKQYFLADNNPDLISVYDYLKQEGDDFIIDCERYFKPKYNEKNQYLILRELFNTTTDARLKACLFIYLNRHGYNGLCRYNSKKIYNVPFGSYVKPLFPIERMQIFHQKLQNAKIECSDFVDTIKNAKKGDVVYCDPPYVPLTQTAYFTNYSHKNFSEDQQIQLAQAAKKVSKNGTTVLISNHDTQFTRKIYKGAKIISFKVHRNISCNGHKRVSAKELLAIFS
ncbi:MAG: Dam family site-specific DNA-(adenine-N6)-methyltransferase [Gammaproteobacteria bacterium]